MRAKQPDYPQIIRAMNGKGVTVRQLAAQVGTSKSTINRIKNEHQRPSEKIGDELLIMFLG